MKSKTALRYRLDSLLGLVKFEANSTAATGWKSWNLQATPARERLSTTGCANIGTYEDLTFIGTPEGTVEVKTLSAICVSINPPTKQAIAHKYVYFVLSAVEPQHAHRDRPSLRWLKSLQ
ncbi:unnamed protein product [Phytophthora lilii]|uniref:Unnamed protein product n=1 Tax=Phytophthora lilii TaxID=2077276 RepID=A0A9W6WXX7_9STRA|nr:unnamed protein product [Phytophthora lilii]